MLTTAYMQQLMESKKRPATDPYEIPNDNRSVPTTEPEVKKQRKTNFSLIKLTSDETLGDSDEENPSVVQCKSARSKKQDLSSIFNTTQLENNEAIIQWIVNNKRFLIASFHDRINHWLADKLKTDPTYEIHKATLNLFTTAFEESLNNPDSVDVRKVDLVKSAQLFSSAHACFIDAVNGLPDDLGRCSDILSNKDNNVLRQFLYANPTIADCLAYGLPSLNKIAKLWESEHPVQQLIGIDCLSPLKSPVRQRSKAISPKKPLNVLPPLSVEEANALWGKNLDNLSKQPNSKHLDIAAVSLNLAKDDNETVTRNKADQSPVASPKKSPVSNKLTEFNIKSPGKLAAGSMNSIFNFSNHSGAPGKVVISFGDMRPIISAPPATSLLNKCDSKQIDDELNNKTPSILRKRRSGKGH